MTILGAFAVPHPPIIVPGVGKGEEVVAQATVDAFHQVSKRIAELKPDLLVLITPHGELYRDAFHITVGDGSRGGSVRGDGIGSRSDSAWGDSELHNVEELRGSKVWGDFTEFRDPKDRLEFTLDDEFIEALILCAEEDDPPLPYVASPLPDNKLDHGCMVPLYFIAPQTPCKIARIAVSLLDEQAHERMGRCLAGTLAALGKQENPRRAVIIASGDLSHKGRGSHYGYSPAGPLFDRLITTIFTEGDLEKLMTFEEDLREEAAECGLNSFIVMHGALQGSEFESRLLSYEAPWGIGYGVASFEISRQARTDVAVTTPSLPVRLAFAVLDDLLAGYKAPDVNTPAVAALIASLNAADQNFYKELHSRQAGCFASFHRGADLRGCIGTIAATCDNLFEEICQNTVSAVSRDPRFPAVRREEVPQLSCSVDVLGEAESVKDRSQLDAKRYGVIVSAGLRRGVLLPDLEGVDTPEEQIAIALQKAGISPKQNYELERFEVIRYE